MSGTNKVIVSTLSKGNQSALTSALSNANAEAIKIEDKKGKSDKKKKTGK